MPRLMDRNTILQTSVSSYHVLSRPRNINPGKGGAGEKLASSVAHRMLATGPRTNAHSQEIDSHGNFSGSTVGGMIADDLPLRLAVSNGLSEARASLA